MWKTLWKTHVVYVVVMWCSECFSDLHHVRAAPQQWSPTTNKTFGLYLLDRLMKIVVADDLPASALELIRAEAGWVVDARSGRKPAALAADLADADGLLMRSAT